MFIVIAYLAEKLKIDLEKQSYKYKIVKDHEIEISMSVLISEKKKN
jgi:hypothetical protein